MLLQESSNQLNGLAPCSSGLSRQSSKKAGGSRSRLSSSNEEPVPDMFEIGSGEEAKKVMVLSERRQIRNEITSNVKAKQAEKAELLAMKEKATKAEGIDR